MQGDRQANQPAGPNSRGERALRRLRKNPVVQPAGQASQDATGTSSGNSNGKRKVWTIEGLPQGIDLQLWNFMLVPSFLKYFARCKEPWDANNYLDLAQDVWNKIFPTSSFILTHNNDAVYPLVRHFHHFYLLELIFFTLATPAHI
jgi:hypothetical protein